MCFHHISHFAFYMLHAYQNMHNAHSTQYTNRCMLSLFFHFSFHNCILFLSYFVCSINSTEVSIIIAKTCFQHFFKLAQVEWILYTIHIQQCTTCNTHLINKYKMLTITHLNIWIPVESKPDIVFTIVSMHGITFKCGKIVICVFEKITRLRTNRERIIIHFNYSVKLQTQPEFWTNCWNYLSSMFSF